MKVINHRLADAQGQVVKFAATGNQAGFVRPIYLLIHYTAGASAQAAVSWLQNKHAKASAHLIIDRDGSVVQMVPFNKIAWHAGKSRWGELTGLNQYSLGIELVNAGQLKKYGNKWFSWDGTQIPDQEVVEALHKNETEPSGWQVYTARQIEKAVEIAMALNEKYRFEDILGHEDVAPDRKIDPGPAFPLENFRSVVLGRM